MVDRAAAAGWGFRNISNFSGMLRVMAHVFSLQLSSNVTTRVWIDNLYHIKPAKYHGVGTLTWSHHINHISNKLSRICGVLSRLKHYVPVLILKIIYNSLFLSHLNYGITAWGFNVGPRIKTLQKKAIRYISNAKYNSHTTPVFKNLQLLQAVDIFKLACFNFFF